MHPRSFLHCLVSLALLGPVAFACSSETSASSGNAAPGSGDGDAGTPTNRSDAPCNAPTITFEKSPVVISPTRDHHVTLIREVGGIPYLYILGGEQEDFSVVLDDVQRARINPDGSIESFEAAGKIPMGRAGAALGVVGDDVVLAGGVVQRPNFTDEILVARFDAQGHLDNWKSGPTLPTKVQHAAAVVSGRDVFIFGGTTGSAASTVSAKTTVGEDGTLSPLVSLAVLPGPRSHHAAFLDQDAIYLVGGLDKGPVGNPPSRSDVVRTRIQGDGTLAQWETVGALSSPLSVSAVERVGCSLLFPGGLDDSTSGPFSKRILRGSLASDGTFRTESALEKNLSQSRGHVHQTPVYKQFIYSVGGRANGGATLGTVDIGRIAE